MVFARAAGSRNWGNSSKKMLLWKEGPAQSFNMLLYTWKLLRVDFNHFTAHSHTHTYTHTHLITLTTCGDRCVTYLDLGNCSTMYMYIKSLHCRLYIYTIVFVIYFSAKLKSCKEKNTVVVICHFQTRVNRLHSLRVICVFLPVALIFIAEIKALSLWWWCLPISRISGIRKIRILRLWKCLFWPL